MIGFMVVSIDDEFFKSVTAWELEQIHYNVPISDDVFKVLSACSIVRII